MTEADPALQARILDGLWRVVAEHGWRGASLARIAAASGTSLGELRGMAACPEDLLRLHGRAVDRAVLDGTIVAEDESPRDRIFDLLMRRLDAMQPHRAGILRFLKDLPFDPLLAFGTACELENSMAWMLEAAGLEARGAAGSLRSKGLVMVWLYTVKAWAKDDSADLATTMAALDKALDRADQLARTLDRGAKPSPADAAAEPASGPQPV